MMTIRHYLAIVMATRILNAIERVSFSGTENERSWWEDPHCAPGGILEVDDSAGVVGEVLQSGLPQIWNRGSDEESGLTVA